MCGGVHCAEVEGLDSVERRSSSRGAETPEVTNIHTPHLQCRCRHWRLPNWWCVWRVQAPQSLLQHWGQQGTGAKLQSSPSSSSSLRERNGLKYK